MRLDEASDCSNQVQLTLVIRYVDSDCHIGRMLRLSTL